MTHQSTCRIQLPQRGQTPPKNLGETLKQWFILIFGVEVRRVVSD